MLINIWRVGVRRMGPNSFQWCPATGQGAMGTNWSIGSSVWTWGRTSSLWGWRSTGTGSRGRLWSLLLWRCSNPAWTRSCAAYCRWPCFGRGGGLDDPQRSLPTPNILWFCVCILPGYNFLQQYRKGWIGERGGEKKKEINERMVVKTWKRMERKITSLYTNHLSLNGRNLDCPLL